MGDVLMFENEKELKESEASRWEVLGMIKQHPVITISVLVLVVAGLFFVFRSSQATTSANKPDKTANINKEEKKLPVEISTAKKGAISSSIVTTASLEPDRQVTMVSETSGIVSKILVDEDKVSAKRVTPAGRSQYFPIETTDTPEGRSKNRRIEIVLTPDIKGIMDILSGAH